MRARLCDYLIVVDLLFAFLAILSVILFAFGLAMRLLLGDLRDEYQNWWDTLLTLFDTMLGNQNFDFAGTGEPTQYAAQLFMVIFLLFNTLLLLNLLIAFLTDAYASTPLLLAARTEQSLTDCFGRESACDT